MTFDFRYFSDSFKSNSFCIYPVKSLVINKGFDGTGTHCKKNKSNNKNINLDMNWLPEKFTDDIIVNDIIIKNFRKNFKSNNNFLKILNMIKRFKLVTI